MRYLSILVLLFLVYSCNQSDDSANAYGDLLDQQPYKPLTDSIKRTPKRDDLYFRRAVLLNKNNQKQPALTDFQAAWSLNQEETYAVGISNLLVEKNKDSAAIFLGKAINTLPNSIYLKLTLAKTYGELNRIDDALATCQVILRIDPDQLNTLMYQADLQEQKDDLKGMVATLEKAHSLQPANADINRKLAYQYAELKEPRALALADTLITLDSLKKSPDPYYIKGTFYGNTKQQAQAINYFNQAITRDYNFLNAHLEKGKILFEQGNYQPAMETFSLINRIKPAFPDGWYWLGRCQEKTGKNTDALDNYDRAFALDKTFTEAKDAAAALTKTLNLQ